jgi:hypothetical protein
MHGWPVELLVFSPFDAHPTSHHFDGPLALPQAVGAEPEAVPGFTSILNNGIIHRCAAYYAKGGKQNGQPINSWATALWHMALKREGYERALRRIDGTIADWLTGNVAVVCRSPFSFGSAGDPILTMLR